MRRSNLPIALAGVFAVSFYAYGQLGGAQGIDLPYSGFLEENGGAVTDTAVDFTFRLFDAAGAGSPCDTVDVTDVVVADGRFALVLDGIAQACVVGKDLHVEVGVDLDQTGTPSFLAGRQRVFPALGALTSGPADFAVAGALSVTGASQVGALTGTSITSTGAVGGATLSITGSAATGALSASSVTTTGDIRNTAANGQVGVSADKVFRDTGDNWLRLNNASGGSNYADFAAGALFAAGDLSAESNAWGSCYWTGWTSGSNAQNGVPGTCTTCNVMQCANGYYLSALEVAHNGGDGNYWTGLQLGGLCCRL
jgi:hypothetical protein